MKIPMLPTAIFVVLSVFLCAAFVYDSSSPQNNVISAPLYFDDGEVLGISEEAALETLNHFREQYGLPKSQTNDSQKPESLIPKKINDDKPVFYGSSGLVMDGKTGTIIFEDDCDESMPIASITKLMTALVFLDKNPGWDSEYTIRREDIVSGGLIYIRIGEKVAVKDLFNLSLVASANSETKALAASTGLSEDEFVLAMNEKAFSLGLVNTHFVDPVGLASGNVSTARELARLAQTAFSDENINKASLTKKYTFRIGGSERAALTTNSLLYRDLKHGISITGGKTGFIKAAGYCFVGSFTDEDGNEIYSVVLGGPDINSRFTETQELVEWAYSSYSWEG